MLNTSHDITQMNIIKENGFIATSQNWSALHQQPGNGKIEDESLVEDVSFYQITVPRRVTKTRGESKKKRVEEARRVEKSGWKGIWWGVVTKHPTNGWWQVTRSSWAQSRLLRQNAGMWGEWDLWWLAKRRTCGWQSHGSNHKCHSSPSTTSHTIDDACLKSHSSMHPHHGTHTWLDGSWKSGRPHCVYHHTIHSSKPHTSPSTLCWSTPSFRPSFLPSSCSTR